MPFQMSVMYKIDAAPAPDGGVHEFGHWMDTNTPSAAGANANIANFPHQLSLRASGSHSSEHESNLTYSGESGGLNESHSAETQQNPPSWGLDRIDQHDSAWFMI